MRFRIDLKEPPLDELAQHAPLTDVLAAIAGLGQAELETGAALPAGSAGDVHPIRFCEHTIGQVALEAGDGARRDAAGLMVRVVEHALERETAIADLSKALLETYSELNLLYGLLPALSTRTSEEEIGELLVRETARALASMRVVLLVTEAHDDQTRILAEIGGRVNSAPLADAIENELRTHEAARRAMDVASPDYDSALQRLVLRAPLHAQQTLLGVLLVTQHERMDDYTSHDKKLVESLAAVGASALLNCRAHSRMRRQMVGTIAALASAVDAKDQATHAHSRRVADLCLAAARQMQLTDSTALQELELAALLHDVGKIGIPDEILLKKGPLTDAERNDFKRHVTIGADILKSVDGLERMRDCVLHHHERFDGRGYPDGLAGTAIPLGSRLIAVADAYDCITSDRPYRSASTPEVALRELRTGSGSHFDPAVVDALVGALQEGQSPS